jgi:hypothetical protein
VTDSPITEDAQAPEADDDAKVDANVVSANASAFAETDDLIFETLWGRVLEAWDDDKTHAALIEYAVRTQHLPDAAGRYRALTNDPDKAIIAKKKLDGIVIAATQMLMSMKTPAIGKTPWQITLSAVLICVVLVSMVGYLILHRGR